MKDTIAPENRMQRRRSSASAIAHQEASSKKKNVCLIKMKSVVLAEELKDDNISLTSNAITIKASNGKLQNFLFDTVIQGNERTSTSPYACPVANVQQAKTSPDDSVAEHLGASVSSASKFVSLGFDSSIYVISRPRNSGLELEASMIEYQVKELFTNVYPDQSVSASSSPDALPASGGLVMKRRVTLSVYEIFENRIRDLTTVAAAAPASGGTNAGPRMLGDYVDGLNKLDCADASSAMSTIRNAFYRRTCMGIAQDVSYNPPPAAAEDGQRVITGSAAFPTFSDTARSDLKGFGTWSSSVSAQSPNEQTRMQLRGYKNGRLLGPVGHVFVTFEVEQHVCALRKMQMRRRTSKLDIVCLAAAELLNFKPEKHELISFFRFCDFKPDLLKNDDGVKVAKKVAALQVTDKMFFIFSAFCDVNHLRTRHWLW